MNCKQTKHYGKFVRNVVRRVMTDLPGGMVNVQQSVVGLYKCDECGVERFGKPNRNAAWPRIEIF